MSCLAYVNVKFSLFILLPDTAVCRSFVYNDPWFGVLNVTRAAL